MYSWVCSSAKALLGELWREEAFMPPLPLTPSSLPQGLCFLPLAPWLEGVCACVSDMGSGRSDEGGKEAFCGPSNLNTPALFSQT